MKRHRPRTIRRCNPNSSREMRCYRNILAAIFAQPFEDVEPLVWDEIPAFPQPVIPMIQPHSII